MQTDEQVPEVKDKPKRTRAPRRKPFSGAASTETAPTATLQLTADDIMRIIKEAKAPSDKQLAQEKEEAERKEERMASMVQLAAHEMAMKEASQVACGHTREDHKPTVVGQVHSDGMIHPICLRCAKEFRPFPASEEHRMNGVEFSRVPPN